MLWFTKLTTRLRAEESDVGQRGRRLGMVGRSLVDVEEAFQACFKFN
jgi:hypothetical protein